MKTFVSETKSGRRVQSGGCAIHCQDCSISQLCIPFTLNEHELDQLDNIIERKKPIQKSQVLLKRAIHLILFMPFVLARSKPTLLVKLVKNK